MKNFLLLFFMTLMLTACYSPGMSEELQVGKDSFKSGDYKDAFHQLLPLAANGKAQAQYAVGYMYYNGFGVTQDTESGIFWMKRAADQHYPPAMSAMRDIDKDY